MWDKKDERTWKAEPTALLILLVAERMLARNLVGLFCTALLAIAFVIGLGARCFKLGQTGVMLMVAFQWTKRKHENFAQKNLMVTQR